VTRTTYRIYVIIPIDILRKDEKGVVWMASAENADSAKAMVDELRRTYPGEYVVFDQDTEIKLTLAGPTGDTPRL
jgi:hypothetical protein